ncbi:DGTP_triphosphohydrolase [Hexamita inflata]|uniref:dGTP triphosphohydrolase n=1 Tax=Hexamita inflata TaxID=28002 RepID=A0AA86P8D6_9EUKA|nr:DGTP triphosphohydrolase [Hexamita inflata]
MVKNFQDPIYGPIAIEDEIIKIINTVQFQRLRRLKQNGNAFMVYASATHTRFEHCIGVYHLTNQLLKSLQKEVDAFIMDAAEREQYIHATLLVRIAAVCHDIGHGAFSHLFENVLQRINIHISHEEIGQKIVTRLLQELNYTQNDIKTVNQLIKGEQPDQPLFKRFAFLSQIVSNSVSSLDTDKLDYLVRDTNAVHLAISVNAERILQNFHVFELEGIIFPCFENNVRFEVDEAFHARYALHKQLYQHAKVVSADQNCLEILLLASKLQLVDFQAAIDMLDSQQPDWFDLYDEIDDNMVENVHRMVKRLPAENQSIDMQNLKAAIQRYKTHSLYPSVYRAYVSSEFFSMNSTQLRQNILDQINKDDVFIAVKEIHFGMKELNPSNYLAFRHQNKVQIPKLMLQRLNLNPETISYNKNLIKIIQTPLSSLTTPNMFREYAIFVYCKKEKNTVDRNELKQLALMSRKAISSQLKTQINIQLNGDIEVMEQYVYE